MGRVKTKRARNITMSPCFWRHRHSRETRVKMKISPARSLAKMAAPVSTNLFHFALENSVQKGDRTSNAKNANTRR